MSATTSSDVTAGDRASGRPNSRKVRHRPSWIVFVVLGAIVCLGMGIWQLARYQAVTGTVQNLGYTFMWPFLAGFLVYAYFKYIRLEADEAEGAQSENRSQEADEAGTPGRQASDDTGAGARERMRSRARTRGPALTEIPADILPARRAPDTEAVADEGLLAYNTYLAELARQDRAAGDQSQENAHR